MKKTALGLTIAMALSTVVACAPADDAGQGTRQQNTGNMGGQYQDGTMFQNRGLGTNRDGIMGGTRREARGMDREGIYGRDADTRIGMTGRDRLPPGPGAYGGGTLRGGYGGSNMPDRGPAALDRGPRTGFDGGMGTGRGAGFFDEDGRAGDADKHGTYDHDEAERLEQRIEAMDNVRDCTVVPHGNDILVAVDTTDDNDNVESKIRSEVSKNADGRKVHVTTNGDMGKRLNAVNQRLRDGEPIRSTANEITDLIQDFGRGVATRR